jgi:hypothetical protein
MGIFDAFVQSQGADLSLKELSSRVKGDEKLLSKYPYPILVINALLTDFSL